MTPGNVNAKCRAAAAGAQEGFQSSEREEGRKGARRRGGGKQRERKILAGKEDKERAGETGGQRRASLTISNAKSSLTEYEKVARCHLFLKTAKKKKEEIARLTKGGLCFNPITTTRADRRSASAESRRLARQTSGASAELLSGPGFKIQK